MDLHAALEAYDAAEEAGELSYQKNADNYSVTRSTLSRRHRGVCASREDGYSLRQKLTPQQEYELCSFITDLTEQGLAPKRQMVVNLSLKWPNNTLEMAGLPGSCTATPSSSSTNRPLSWPPHATKLTEPIITPNTSTYYALKSNNTLSCPSIHTI